MNRPTMWMGIPVGIFAILLIIWCATLEPATGEQLSGLGSYIGLFAAPFCIAIALHALTWMTLKARTKRAGLEERVWWLTLPFLHAVWLLWPLVLLLGMLLVERRVFARSPVVLSVPFCTPIVWRCGWMLMSRISGTSSKPCPRHWITAAVLGTVCTLIGLLLAAVLIVAGV